ncbi:hypothetical protein M0802_013886 [Mischocyttarus mexicanus]|nr:hypothetical protein M0802_013886 [Mischocyttarus mexicanus]
MLLEKIPGAQGHHMYTDRYYTSYFLAQNLSKLKCNLTGTIFTNRKGLPKEIKKPNFSKKSTVAYRQNNTLVLGWKDKRVVTCLTTAVDTGMTTVKRITRGDVNIMVKKPNIVVNYIKNMGGVDRADQYASTYCFLRKSLKWWRIYSSMFEFSTANLLTVGNSLLGCGCPLLDSSSILGLFLLAVEAERLEEVAICEEGDIFDVGISWSRISERLKSISRCLI